MRHDSRAYLWNVREAADAILRFLAGIDFDTYASTEMLYSAAQAPAPRPEAAIKPAMAWLKSSAFNSASMLRCRR